MLCGGAKSQQIEGSKRIGTAKKCITCDWKIEKNCSIKALLYIMYSVASIPFCHREWLWFAFIESINNASGK